MPSSKRGDSILYNRMWFKPNGMVCLVCRDTLGSRSGWLAGTVSPYTEQAVSVRVREWHKEVGALMYVDATRDFNDNADDTAKQ